MKLAISEGMSVGEASRKWSVPYQVAYRLAKGETWAAAKPSGDVLGDVNRGTPGRLRTVTLRQQYGLWKRRRQYKESTKSIAQSSKLSGASVRRLVAEFEMMLAYRVSTTQLTSGTYDLAMRRYRLSQAECERLDQLSQRYTLPPRLVRVVERQFASMEKKIKTTKGKPNGKRTRGR